MGTEFEALDTPQRCEIMKLGGVFLARKERKAWSSGVLYSLSFFFSLPGSRRSDVNTPHLEHDHLPSTSNKQMKTK